MSFWVVQIPKRQKVEWNLWPSKYLSHFSRFIYHVDEKTLTISLFNNFEKLVQILLEFSQQIVEGYEFVLAKFR